MTNRLIRRRALPLLAGEYSGILTLEHRLHGARVPLRPAPAGEDAVRLQAGADLAEGRAGPVLLHDSRDGLGGQARRTAETDPGGLLRGEGLTGALPGE